MKLWEIKAEALKLMFTDTDLSFSEEEFIEGVILENSNTREKYIGMEGSIRRAIDLYYQFNGQYTKFKDFVLDTETVDDTTTYLNTISLSSEEDLDFPSRIDIIPNLTSYIRGQDNVAFDYDFIDKKITFIENDMSYYEGDISFRIYYKLKKANLPIGVNEMTYDLNVLYIPEEIQRKIPYYIKGELFEEDESNLAQASKQEYLSFLISNQRNKFVKKQPKVKNKYPRGTN